MQLEISELHVESAISFGLGTLQERVMVDVQTPQIPKDLRIQEAKVKDLYQWRQEGRLTMDPIYQRGSVWNDERRYALVDTVHQKFPLGVVMLEVNTSVDADGELIEVYSVLDGQQRLNTLFDYLRGENAWTRPTREIELYPFTRFQDLTATKQRAVEDYEVPVAYLRHYDADDVEVIFLRVQFGMALTAGEKIKNVKSQHRELIRELTDHPVFSTTWGKGYTKRDLHWMLSASFFMSACKRSPKQRFEYKSVHNFLRSISAGPVAGPAAKNIAKKIMTRFKDILSEASSDPSVLKSLKQSPRFFKMLFAAIYYLDPKFAIFGHETRYCDRSHQVP